MKKILILCLLLLISINSEATLQIDHLNTDHLIITTNPAVPFILPLGDSITIGIQWSYRKTLQDLLGIGSYNFVGIYTNPSSDAIYDVETSGHSGDITSQISTRLSTELSNNFTGTLPSSSKILIHAGTNDVGTGLNLTTAVNNISTMIDNIVATNSAIDIYVALIVPNKTGSVNTDTITFNGLLNTMLSNKRSSNSRVHTVDMYSAFINDTFSLCSGAWATNCMADNTHPNEGAGYNTMAYQWNSCILNAANTNCDGH